ncbi:hypothetical protein CLV30_11299 [Haloactinopolyspora alba]|uniref:Monooxygenase ydhR n=1 Tax=Haloactinopolyspora alba TaxID=648780 RepID=A0A2P8DXA5_9ACTN|nr:hypothetical protein [Haloactinopolyspora alba]PSL01860.1 hypothetical protein CLV30_11299 [Haloactinopolyspora alba]
MYGLTVRWSLAQAPEGVDAELREYVHGTSLARFSEMDGLRFKTWRTRPGEWFEGTYVFETAQARDEFAESFAATAADSPGSRMIGSPPILQETFDVVAVAEGKAGFAAGPGPDPA